MSSAEDYWRFEVEKGNRLRCYSCRTERWPPYREECTTCGCKTESAFVHSNGKASAHIPLQARSASTTATIPQFACGSCGQPNSERMGVGSYLRCDPCDAQTASVLTGLDMKPYENYETPGDNSRGESTWELWIASFKG
jgi:hypothetical protein